MNKKDILDIVKSGTYQVYDCKKAPRTYKIPKWMIVLADTVSVPDIPEAKKQVVKDHLSMELMRMRAKRRG